MTDPLQIIANALTTIDSKDLFDFLSLYVQKEKVERIIIGKPLQLNANPSENFLRVENFVNRWKNAHPEVPIVYYDERFTSVMAQRVILQSGVKKKTRRENKGLVDEISATIILQDYMSSRRWFYLFTLTGIPY